MKNRKQGSGLILVVIVTTTLSVGVFSVLKLVNGEFLRNKKAAVFTEAKHAAEAIMQSASADLRTRFENSSAFPSNALAPDRNPLGINADFISIHSASDSGSHLVLPNKTRYDSIDDFNTEPTEVIGGQIPPGKWRYIDRRVPGNEFDELAGTRVFERSIEMLSKATVDQPNVGTATVYARQFLQVRDAPVFAYAIFYNMPMEIAPGPAMEVHGNVHSNHDSWFQSNNSLDFYSKVTIAGMLNHGRHPDSGRSASNGDVNFMNGSENLVNMKEDSSWPTEQRSEFDGEWLTSSSEDFYNLSNQLYEGNLQASAHGILPQNPVGVEDYNEDTNSITSAKESFNSAYPILQPPLNQSELAIPSETTDPSGYAAAKARNELEQQKYAYKAGLVIKVDTAGSIDYLTYERDSSGNLRYDSSGTPITRQLTPSDSIAEYREFREELDGGTWEITSGMHDKRQAADLNTVEIDVGKLKNLVHANDQSNWGGSNDQRPQSWWNGVVYVEFETQETSSSRPDGVNPALSGTGVKLKNGSVIPNPSFAHSRDIYGMSLATNQMMYVEGHYNADGDFDTGSPTEPDDPSNFAREGHEAPAALIADSLTFLSGDWDDSNSNRNLNNREARDTEVSAAIMTGSVPSGKTGSDRYSGGVENFPRFLEDWNNLDLRIRGSLVALFESEIGTRGWGYSDVYTAPDRQWGFHDKFAEGYLPPGTPNTRRYRIVDFQMVDKQTYENHVTRIKTYFE